MNLYAAGPWQRIPSRFALAWIAFVIIIAALAPIIASSRITRAPIPWSPSERQGDRNGAFMRPGSFSDEALSANVAAGIARRDVVYADLVPIILERIRSLPVDKARIDAMLADFAHETGTASGINGAELQTLVASHLRQSGRIHYLGTDSLGQDVASQLVHASRTAISVGFVAAGIAALIGIIIGAAAGYFGGWIDAILLRLIEVFMSMPLLFILIAAAGLLPQGIYITMALIGCFTWTGAARLTRAEFLRFRTQDFILAARAAGASPWSIAFRQILPNAAAPVIIDTTFSISAALLLESTLGYLGLAPAGHPSWGRLLAQAAAETGEFMWWLGVFPGLAIFLTVLSYNILGESLRRSMGPRI